MLLLPPPPHQHPTCPCAPVLSSWCLVGVAAPALAMQLASCTLGRRREMLPVAHDSMLFSKMGLFCFLPLSLLPGPYAECFGQAKHQRMLSRVDGSC